MNQHIRDVRLQTLSRTKQHAYYDEIQGLFETIAGHCEVAQKKKETLIIEVPHLGEFTISHRTLGDIEKAKIAAQKADAEKAKAEKAKAEKAAAAKRKQAAAKKTESATAQTKGED